MSSDSAKPRCTPPMPPVPMNVIPASRAAASVPPTVVEPSAPWTTQAAMSRAPALRAFVPASANRCRAASSRPILTAPSAMPTVAGTAPAARTRSLGLQRAASPRPPENPCETSVVSSATTGRRPPAPASPGGHPVGYPQRDRHGIAPIFATALAAASSPSRTPPTRYPAANASPAPVASTARTGNAG